MDAWVRLLLDVLGRWVEPLSRIRRMSLIILSGSSAPETVCFGFRPPLHDMVSISDLAAAWAGFLSGGKVREPNFHPDVAEALEPSIQVASVSRHVLLEVGRRARDLGRRHQRLLVRVGANAYSACRSPFQAGAQRKIFPVFTWFQLATSVNSCQHGLERSSTPAQQSRTVPIFS